MSCNTQGVQRLAYVLLPERFSVEDGTLSADLSVRRAEVISRYASKLSVPDSIIVQKTKQSAMQYMLSPFPNGAAKNKVSRLKRKLKSDVRMRQMDKREKICLILHVYINHTSIIRASPSLRSNDGQEKKAYVSFFLGLTETDQLHFAHFERHLYNYPELTLQKPNSVDSAEFMMRPVATCQVYERHVTSYSLSRRAPFDSFILCT